VKLRSLLLFAAGGAAIGLSLAHADVTVDSRLSVYTDSDNTAVITPYVRAAADVTENGNLSAIYTADAISSASIDVVSNASKAPIHDYRNEGEVSYSQILGDFILSGTYIYSGEHDYRSNTGALSLARNLFDKNTTLAWSAAYGADVVGRAGDPAFAKPLTVVDGSFSWTQTVRPDLITQVAYELIYDNGYQASPYRYVPIGLNFGAPIAKIAENDPDLRTRNAVTGAANWAITEDTALGGDYRFYFDDWGMRAHTVDLRLSTYLSPSWLLRFDGRAYTQNSVFFYQPHYTQIETYRTMDRELSRLTEEQVGAKLEYALPGFGPGKQVTVDAKVDLYYWQMPDFPLLTHRVGDVVELGLGGRY
jgi:hypothetical protein